MSLAFKRVSPTEQSDLTAGNTTIVLPQLNISSSSSSVITKALQTKVNPFMSIDGKSTVQGDVITIVISNTNGSEISIKNSSKPFVIRLTRPIDQYPEYRTHTLLNTSFQYHRVSLPKDEMTLSVHISPIEPTALDTYAVYVSYGMNESTVEPPTEWKFDEVFVLPNTTVDANLDEQNELKYTIFMPPTRHRVNVH